jgi:glyoxylase-like metal-dependent hydrolase (beta-lactamase superfamily II)
MPIACRLACLALSASLAAACAAQPPPPPQAPAAAPAAQAERAYDGQVSRFEGDRRIGVYVSIPWGFSTSSYWIEGPDGLIAIDTQFLPSATEEMITAAEAMTGKKFKLAIVLHANPDKFNGTATFQKHGVKVVTSREVLDVIPAIHEKRRKAFYERYQPDYPKELPQPASFGDKTMEITEAGVTLKAHVLGPGCSEAHVVVEFDGHLFPGDLIANGTHSWLEIGRTDEWLRRLDEMKAMKPRFVHPGRGASGGAELLDQEAQYLRKVIDLVAAEQPVLPPDKEAIKRAKKRIEEAFPNLDFPVFLNIGIPSEYARQARLTASPKAAP